MIERSEERLTVDKDMQQVGSVRVGKRVVEETQSVDVPVTREELVIERRSVDRPTGKTLTEDSVEIPVYGEHVRTGKDARVVEELEVGKTARTDTQRVTDTVRQEEFDVDVDEDVRDR
ncbi:MAG: YsnF/AvaK domain-containing protein [Chloroflexi bacterium]|nr:YsnF/AvaK domain-containing protein [Chloroflexota bacterium]